MAYHAQFQVEDSPEDYPFSLSEREFAYYSSQNFGGEMKDISGIYKPTSFYKALAQDCVVYGLGTAAGAFLPFLIPEWAAVEGAGVLMQAVPGAARGAAGTMAGSVAQHLLPGGAWDAAKKDRLWRRYKLDYERRGLA